MSNVHVLLGLPGLSTYVHPILTAVRRVDRVTIDGFQPNGSAEPEKNFVSLMPPTDNLSNFSSAHLQPLFLFRL